MKVQRGFTLIELMIVLAIVLILAAIAIPAYHDYLIRSQVSEGISVSGTARAAVWEYASSHGSLPADNPAAGLPSATSITGSYVSQVQVVANGIEVTYGNTANSAITGATLIIEPTLSAGGSAVNWDCAGGTLSPKYRPTRCR